MSSAEIKSNFHNLIDAINDSKTLKALYALISNPAKKTDGWDALTKRQQKEIEDAILSIKKEEDIPHEKVMAKYKDKYF